MEGSRRANGIFTPAATQSSALALANAGGEREIVTGEFAERLDRIRAQIRPLQRGVPRAEDEPRDACHLHRARAHRTRLHRGVHGGARELLDAVLARDPAQGLELRVPRHVALGVLAVLTRREHHAVAHEHGAHGPVASPEGVLRLAERQVHIISVGHGSDCMRRQG